MDIIKVVNYPVVLVPDAVYLKEMPNNELEISVSDNTGASLKKLAITDARNYTNTQVSALLNGVPAEGNTLNKLYSLFQSSLTLTNANVVTALGYTPYNATNPNEYQTAAQVSTTLNLLAPKLNPIFAGRIQADFGNASIANRVMFQSDVLNTNSNLEILPNGAGQISTVIAGATNDPTNTSIIYIQARLDLNETRLESTRRGTGAYLPLNFYTGGVIRMAIDSAGNVTIGGSAAQTAAHKNVSGGIAGLTGYNINLKNDAGTITSLLANANTVARTYTLPDKSGTVAMISDVTPVAHVGAGGTVHAVATTSIAGFMSSTDKTKLDGVAAGAQVNVATNLAVGVVTATTVPVTSSTGSTATLQPATNAAAGVMTATDKAKLDAITGTNTGDQTTITGNAGSATKLQTARLIAGKSFDGTADITLAKADVGLGNVDNTSDANKPVSTAQAAADTAAIASALSTVRGGVVVAGDTLGKLYTMITAIQSLMTSDDLTLDTIQEIVTYIKSEQTVINSLGSTKVNISDIINGLTDTSTNKPLSAAQGKVLKDALDGLTTTVGTKVTSAQAAAAAPVQSVAGRTGVVTLVKADVGLGNVDNTSDANKPVSTAQATADSAVQTAAATDATTKANAAQAAAIAASAPLAHVNAGGTAHAVATTSVAGFLSATDKTKLDGIGTGANVTSVAGKTGAVTLTKTDVGLSNVDNTSDATLLAAALVAVKVTPIVAVGALDVNCGTGNYFTKTIASNSTLTFSNVPSGKAYGFTLKITHTGGAVTFPGSVQWPGGTLPTLTTGKVHLLSFVTDDGGVIWHGVANTNYAS